MPAGATRRTTCVRPRGRRGRAVTRHAAKPTRGTSDGPGKGTSANRRPRCARVTRPVSVGTSISTSRRRGTSPEDSHLAPTLQPPRGGSGNCWTTAAMVLPPPPRRAVTAAADAPCAEIERAVESVSPAAPVHPRPPRGAPFRRHPPLPAYAPDSAAAARHGGLTERHLWHTRTAIRPQPRCNGSFHHSHAPSEPVRKAVPSEIPRTASVITLKYILETNFLSFLFCSPSPGQSMRRACATRDTADLSFMLVTSPVPQPTQRHRRPSSLVSPSPSFIPAPFSLWLCFGSCCFSSRGGSRVMAARAALARSIRPLLLRRGVSTTVPAAASSAVAITGASLRAELEKVKRFSPNLSEEEAAVLMTPEVRADIAAIAAAEDALMGTIDTTDVSVDWVGCPISVSPGFFSVLWAGGARDAGEEVIFAVSLPPDAAAVGLVRREVVPRGEGTSAAGDWFSLVYAGTHGHFRQSRRLGGCIQRADLTRLFGVGSFRADHEASAGRACCVFGHRYVLWHFSDV